MAPPAAASADLLSLLEAALPQDSRQALRSSVLPALLDAVAAIAQMLRGYHNVTAAGNTNPFGDDQLNVDVAAENLIRDALARCPSVVTATSEEDPVEKPVQHLNGASHDPASHEPESQSQSQSQSQSPSPTAETYTVAFDPLDGSSIIAPNWTVGSIVGIWDGRSSLNQSPREKQVASILGFFGPRTTAVVAVRVPGGEPSCFEVGLTDDGVRTCQVVRSQVRLTNSVDVRYFAPANLRAAAESPQYMALVSHYIQSKYTLRYSGGLVPDLGHILVKGHGIYVSPTTPASKAKLRRLFELCPVALVMECAGALRSTPRTGWTFCNGRWKTRTRGGGWRAGILRR
ncbi:unnamed protein product [Clonostachys solani]|uniref:Uncharacterized protein n=1 Tax=Clonostachys solani TaxID=160281 RepID=A0A9N9W6J6_9HYPO|nr:unnamed protein product [Clonostachys solani]